MCSSVASGCRSRVVTSVRAPETRTLLRMRLREAVPSPLWTRTRWPSRPADLVSTLPVSDGFTIELRVEEGALSARVVAPNSRRPLTRQ